MQKIQPVSLLSEITGIHFNEGVLVLCLFKQQVGLLPFSGVFCLFVFVFNLKEQGDMLTEKQVPASQVIPAAPSHTCHSWGVCDKTRVVGSGPQTPGSGHAGTHQPLPSPFLSPGQRPNCRGRKHLFGLCPGGIRLGNSSVCICFRPQHPDFFLRLKHVAGDLAF